jgi:pyruvate formate lyase activating enzyme
MRIAGVEKNSFVDWPGRLCATVFTSGCDFDCYYCHNRRLIDSDSALVEPADFFAWLNKRRDFIEGVAVSGGEPTLQPNLEPFIRHIRGLGFPVKLDTNGGHPEVLGGLLASGLLDYVAMDVKAPLDRYEELTGVPVDPGRIRASIRLIAGGGVDYEFRTTAAPSLTVEDIAAVAQLIDGADRYVLQQYRPPGAVKDPDASPSNGPAHPPKWFFQAKDLVAPYVEQCLFRGLDAQGMVA